MANGKGAKIANEAKGRFGALALVFAFFSQATGLAFFLSDANLIDVFNVGQNASIYGWYLMVLALLLSTVGLVLGVTMSSK